MTSQRSFVRKIVYFSLIGGLLYPLFWLSLPATTRSKGGMLAQVREKYKLSQADLGEIDPASVTMKLGTFGLHGIAADLLWSSAIKAKEREDWTTFSAALEQIMNLQPNFIQVWLFQAHNVAFNISCEFDDYRERYRYVIRGIKVLERGIHYNDRSTQILRDMGLFTGFKIGHSDEAPLFRPMFRNDKDFHGTDRMKGTRYENRPSTMTDNWLVSKWWFQWVDRLLDRKLAPYPLINPAVVRSAAPMAQIQYATSLEQDGHFDAATLDEWHKARQEWDKFGSLSLRTTQEFSIRLSGLQAQQEIRNQLKGDFDKIAATEPDVRLRLEKQITDALTPEDRKSLTLPPHQGTRHQRAVAIRVRWKLENIPPDQIARAMSPKHREEALRAADRLHNAQVKLNMIENYRSPVNYEYWKILCDVEGRPDTMATRKTIYEGDQAYAASELTTALRKYEEGIAGWKRVIDANPQLLTQRTMVEDLVRLIAKYDNILKQNDRSRPNPFPLQTVLDHYEQMKEQQ